MIGRWPIFTNGSIQHGPLYVSTPGHRGIEWRAGVEREPQYGTAGGAKHFGPDNDLNLGARGMEVRGMKFIPLTNLALTDSLPVQSSQA